MMDTKPRICVHGLGYVGLPTAAVLANSGYEVYGFDIDPEYRRDLVNREFSFEEPDLERFVDRALDDGLTIVEEPESAKFHMICVPTPYDRDLDKTDLSYVEAAAETIAKLSRSGDTIILSSTVPPGTTNGLIRDVVEQEGLSVKEDILLGYSPETVLPGNTLSELRKNDRLVGTVEGNSPDRIVALYDSFVSGDVRTTDATTAEFVKLVQNAYRDVNIAFANEVAKLAHEFGIDSRESISLANEHPRVDILDPGPGVGGHCIPIDPLFLKHGNDVPILIETARTVNDGMIGFVIELLEAAIDDINGSKVAILGVAYKGGVADTRESPTLTLADNLETAGVGEIRLNDPYVAPNATRLNLLPLKECLKNADATIIMTDHPEYGALDPNMFAEKVNNEIVIDTKGILDDKYWTEMGFDMYSV